MRASSVAAQMAGLSLEEQILATSGVVGFFELVVRMICTPQAAQKQYGEIVVGLDMLQEFLTSKHGVILVVWDNIAFKASHDEFGCVIITSLMLRTRPN
jgi:hypothetical protein